MPHDEPISMYVPARNAASTLRACIDAIRAQTRPPDELFIVVDPRSRDETLELARAIGGRICVQEGRTLGSARNQAIAAAAHRWLASCDSDAIIESDWLERLAERREDGAAGIGGATHECVRSVFDAWRALHMPHHWGEQAFRNPFMLVSEVLFDRDALLAVGGYREDLNHYEDSDLCQRLRDAGYDLLYEPAGRATHLRRDDLNGLLDLRWRYSEFRQLHLLDRYAGLLAKIAVNREYALSTLSRSLARGHEEQLYVSFLLFFHHLVLELRSLLSRRPMIDAAARGAYERELVGVACRAVWDSHAALGDWVSGDLRTMLRPWAEEPDASEPPHWQDHLAAVESAVEAFCSQFSRPLRNAIASSAAFVHGRATLDDVRRVPRPRQEELERALVQNPFEPCVNADLLRRVRQQWPGAGGYHVVGRMTESERDALGGLSARLSRGRDAIAIAAHLECEAEPLAVFGRMLAASERLLACYRPPTRFVEGLDVPSASDLASAATAAGWTIERFDTLVGRVCLMASRPARAVRQAERHAIRVETAEVVG